MTTVKAAIKSRLTDDATLAAILTGGVFDADDLPRTGLTRELAGVEADGVTMQPVAVIRWKGATPFMLSNNPGAERRFFEVWFYADRGYAAIEQAKRRVKDLLHRYQIGPTDDNHGLNFVHWVDDFGEFIADELQGAAADRSRYMIALTRR